MVPRAPVARKASVIKEEGWKGRNEIARERDKKRERRKRTTEWSKCRKRSECVA